MEASAFPIALVGAGNLATNLGTALSRAGFPILQVYSRSEDSASALAEKLGSQATTNPEKLVTDAELYIVALKDSALETLLPELLRGREERFWVHTAGSIPMNIWERVPGVKRYGVLYPMQTFSKARLVDFRSIPILLEANAPAQMTLLKEVASTLSRNVREVSSRQRRAIHMAAVFACNFTNHCYALAEKLLAAEGVPFEILLPLIDETARKVHTLPPLEAQTGPAIRYDENVIQKHLDTLSSEPEMQTLYRLMSQSIHEAAQEKSKGIE